MRLMLYLAQSPHISFKVWLMWPYLECVLPGHALWYLGVTHVNQAVKARLGSLNYAHVMPEISKNILQVN